MLQSLEPPILEDQVQVQVQVQDLLTQDHQALAQDQDLLTLAQDQLDQLAQALDQQKATSTLIQEAVQQLTLLFLQEELPPILHPQHPVNTSFPCSTAVLVDNTVDSHQQMTSTLSAPTSF